MESSAWHLVAVYLQAGQEGKSYWTTSGPALTLPMKITKLFMMVSVALWMSVPAFAQEEKPAA
jgi:hypothetical protein